MSRTVLLDTNAVLRFLLDDNHSQHLTVRQTIETEECWCILSVVQEAVYVLEGYYKVPREHITTAFLELKHVVKMEDEDIYCQAFQYYSESPKLDFADCLLCAYQKLRGLEILTFDRKLQKKLTTL